MSRLEWLRRTVNESATSLLGLPKSQCGNGLLPNGLRQRKSVGPSLVEALEDRTLLTNFIVNTRTDDADDAAGNLDGLVSLREAIEAARSNMAFGDATAGSATNDTIRFDAGVFSGSAANRTINIQNGAFIITDDLQIIGAAPNIILDGGGADRIFRIVTNQGVTLTDLTLTNGAENVGSGGGAVRITNGGRTLFNRVVISNSDAAGRGGAIFAIGSDVDLVDTQLIDNTGLAGGGLAIIGGTATLTRSLVDFNESISLGGGVSNDGGRLIVRDSVISRNVTTALASMNSGGGGIHNFNNGRLAIAGSDIIGNQAIAAHGGGIRSLSGAVTITDSIVSNNTSALSGGGIDIDRGSLLLLGSLLGGPGNGSGNIAGWNGGGLHIGGNARVTVEDSTVQFNEAGREGGGLWNSPTGRLIILGGRLPSVTNQINIGSNNAIFNQIRATFNLGPNDPLPAGVFDAFAVDRLRNLFPGGNNGGAPGTPNGGFRQINWDAAPDVVSSPNSFPGDFFNQAFNPRARGALLSTPGTGFQLSATAASNVGTVFSNVNPNYGQTFTTNSAERLFTSVGSNVTVVDFFIPGTNTPALVQGFGAVFTDVDIAGSSKIEYFGIDGKLLLTQNAVAINAQSSLTVTGARFSFPTIAQVRITAGNGSLGPKDVSQNGPADVVVLDDFIYAEPVTPQSIETETIIRGNIAHGNAAHDGGGGIFNAGGRLAILQATIDDNLADGTSGSGGGIFSSGGLVTIDEATITRNESARAGGGIEVAGGRVYLDSSALGGTSTSQGNATGRLPFGLPSPGNGGGLHITGSAFVRLNGGSVQNNTAASEGGGLWNSAGGVLIVQQGADVSGNRALGNAADNGGGGIFNDGGRLVVDSVTIADNRAIGTSGSGGGIFSTNGSVTVKQSLITRNLANRAGGGIEIVRGRIILTDVNLDRNSAGNSIVGNPGNGGALHVSQNARVDIHGGIIQNNSAANEGGGLWNSATGLMILFGGTAIRNNRVFGSTATDGGGGIFNNGGRLVIVSAEISGNNALGRQSQGGGLLSLGGVVTIENSTISGNQANSAGGGISNFGRLTSTNNTIVLNRSNPFGTQIDGGGVYTPLGGFTILRNTLVAGNLTITGTRTRPRESDLGGLGITAAGFSLIGNANSAGALMDGVNGNIVGMQGIGTLTLNLLLDTALVDNRTPAQIAGGIGFATFTHALTFSSLALNNGSNALAVSVNGQPLQFDQRGVGNNRIFNSRVDIGAFER